MQVSSWSAIVRLLIGAVVLAAFAAPTSLPGSAALAQRDAEKRSNSNEPPKKKLKATGTIKGIGSGMLQVVTGDGDQWILRVAAQPQDIHVRAKADTGFLQKGRFVQFVGRFNTRGQAQAPIEKLTVFTPRKNSPFGVTRHRGGGGPREGDKPEKEQVVDPFGDLVPDAKRPDASSETGLYQVSGRISDVKKDWIVVVAGREKVYAEVANDAEVSLDVADLGLARAHDRLDFEAYYYPYPKRVAYATKLVVTSAQPLTSQRARDGGESDGPSQSPESQR